MATSKVKIGKKTTKKAAPKKAMKKVPPKKKASGIATPPQKKAAAKKTNGAKKDTNGAKARTVTKKTPPKKAATATPTGVSQADFEALTEMVTEALTGFEQRLASVEAAMSGYGENVEVTEDGNFKLDLENADYATLRNWAFQFGYEEDVYNMAEDDLRAGLMGVRDADDFEGWDITVEGEAPPLPGAEEPEAEEEEEGDGEEITEESINAMNWTQLTELADHIELDYSHIKKTQPKVLRNAIIQALTDMQEGGEEEPEVEAPEEEEGAELEEGDAVIVTHDGDVYEATFQGWHDEENVNVVWDMNGESATVPVELLSLPG